MTRRLVAAGLIAWTTIGCFQTRALAQIRVFDYNTGEGTRSGIELILAAAGAENANGITKTIDVFTLQEQTTLATTTQTIVNILNGLYGAGTYARATLEGDTSGAGRPALIYNTTTIQLIAQTTASTISASGAARESLRYRLRPIGYDASADFYVYSSHYKAVNDDVSIARRDAEARQVRANADALGNAHIIYAGDFNIYTSAEPMYQTLLAPGNGQAFDPLNRPGDWSANFSFKDIHTQSPVTSSRYDQQVTGGMDDRFDFQLVTAEMLDGEGLSYLPGSYHAFGNTGTHTFNGEIISGSAAALQARLPGYSLQQARDVLTALTNVSDHLPVIADYQVPAKMEVQVAPLPPVVIRGATLSANVSVRNSAGVVVAKGADELDYSIVTSGSLTGTATGIDQALGAAQAHAFTFATATVGLRQGSVSVTSNSQSVSNGTSVTNVSTDVIDHANPSFSRTANEDILQIDFGTFTIGSGMQSRDFTLANLASSLGKSARLDLDSMSGSGDILTLSTGVTPFSNLEVGGSLQFTAFFDTDETGQFSAEYSLLFSDENLPGAAAFSPLSLRLTGQVIPEPAAGFLFALGALFAMLAMRARPYVI